jgi:hypothetical protein
MQTVSLEFFVRAIPEGFLFILAVYTFSNTKVNRNIYILSSILLGCLAYLIKTLPIDYGIHSILILILYIILSTYINKINLIKSIQISIASFITMFMCEGINIIIIKFILRKDLDTVLANPTLKTIYTSPSLLMFACIVVGVYYFRLSRSSKHREVLSRTAN